jgi:predicted ATPase
MEGIEKPHTDKYKEITNDWNYDASCTVTWLPVWDLENFKRLIFVVQSVQYRICACISRTFFDKNLLSKIGVRLKHGIKKKRT